jgi:membrane fusion protein (multidrug efflux system)
MDDMTQDLRLPQSEAAPPKSPAKRIAVLIAAALVLGAAATWGGRAWLESRHFETTDDAQIDADTTQLAPRIAGQVTKLLFTDNQHVAQGQVLVLIDPADTQARLDQARAQQAGAEAQATQARAQLEVQRAAIDQAIANARVTEADLTQARQDYERYQKINPIAVTRQQVDAATAAYRAAEARLDAARQTIAGARAQADAAAAQAAAAEAAARNAQAATRAAELQLSYCTIAAPVAGTVTHATVQLGNYVTPGQPLFALVQDPRWVTANFKETQLADMRPGQDAEITIDAAPGIKLRAKVDSFQAGTGAAFSALPAENATGNYVKIVQRVPVKLTFDDPRAKDLPLLPGMSAVPSVRVR